MPGITPRRSGVLVALLVLASASLRFAAARSVAVPWIAPDESVYALIGRSLYEHGRLDVLSGPTPYYSLVYPLLVGPATAVEDVSLGVTMLQATQAILMSATAAAAYLWARPAAGARWALVAGALSVAIPGLAYSGLVMTEAAAYPAVTLVLLLLSRAIARPSWRLQLAVLAASALACSIRLQAVVVLPTIVVAVALAAWFARDRRLIRALAPLLGVASAALLTAAALTLFADAPLGAYSTTVRSYGLGAVARDVVWHAGDVVILVAAIPLVALAALAVTAFRGRERDAETRAAVAVATTYVTLVVLEVGTFASHYVGHLAERDLLTAVPPLMVVFAVWLARDAPRPQPWTSIAAFAIAAAAILLPIARLTRPTAFLDSFNAIGLRRLAELTSDDVMRALFATAAACLVAAAIFVPRRWLVALPLAVGLVLAVSSVVTSVEVRRLSRADERWWFGTADPGWVDRAADGPVTYIHAGTTFWGGVWKHLFWNRRIDDVVHLPDAPLPGPIHADVVSVRFDGLILDRAGEPLRDRLVVLPYGVRPAGRRLSAMGPSADQPGLALWRLDAPARVRSWTRGVALNGDFRNQASVTVYDCRPGRLEVTLLGKDGAPVTLSVDGRVARRLALPPRAGWSGDVDIRPAPGSRVCRIDLTSAGLVGSTRMAYMLD